jgi:hypothetical protein
MEHRSGILLKGESFSAKANVLAMFHPDKLDEPGEYTNNIDGYDSQVMDPASIEETHQLLREEHVLTN